ncbi:MAG: alpha/beta hydrolase [Thermoplasmata archaeon]|nr:alpha/beta hydrolase [Thermoplasmata archaeon]
MDGGADSIEGAGASKDPLFLVADPFTGGAEWATLIPWLRGGFEVLTETPTADRSSGGPSDDLSVQDARVEAELLRRNIYPVHLMASTFSVAAAIRLALRRPELLRSLILHDPIVRFPAPEARNTASWAPVEARFLPIVNALRSGDTARARGLWHSAFAQPGALDRLTDSRVPAAVEDPQRWLEGWDDPSVWRVEPPAHAEFLPPVLLLEGDRSPDFIRRIGDALASGFPNLSRLTLPNAGHFLPIEEPQRLAGVLFTFCLERNVPSM